MFVPSLAIILNYKYTNRVVRNFQAGNKYDGDANIQSQSTRRCKGWGTGSTDFK